MLYEGFRPNFFQCPALFFPVGTRRRVFHIFLHKEKAVEIYKSSF
jgi:hypothetical protein